MVLKFNEYQRVLLAEAAKGDRRSMQKTLEVLVWDQLEKRKKEENW